MKHTNLFFTALILFTLPSIALEDTYYEQYPVGYIAENPLYDIFNQNRTALRECHTQYLAKIPGGFDGLSVEFLIDPSGKAKPISKSTDSTTKDAALLCIKNLVRGFKISNPNYGIVFIRFTSDIDQQNTTTVGTQELSRNAITVVPYLPRKIINTLINMYMPYYKGCFLPAYITTKAKGSVHLTWNISEEGKPTDIQAISSTPNDKMTACLIQVTEQHRYPSGYIKTPAERTFNMN